MLLFDDGVRRLFVRYVQQRRDGFYYRRRIPRDLVDQLGGQKFRVRSLNTKSSSEATKRAQTMAEEDDRAWDAVRKARAEGTELIPADVTRLANLKLQRLGIRSDHPVDPHDDPLLPYLHSKYAEAANEARDPETGEYPAWRELVDPVDAEVLRIVNREEAPKLLSDALAHYLKEHPRGRQKKFSDDYNRSLKWVFSKLGDRPLAEYTKLEALSVRDAMLEAGAKTQTVRKQLTQIAAVFAKGILDFELPIVRHAFQNIPISGLGDDSTKKATFSTDELVKLAAACRAADDTLRHIVALLINTGARIAEIVGLQVSDVHVDHATPHIVIQPHGSVRTLKTKGSERSVPLVGVSLWAAKRAIDTAREKNKSSGCSPPTLAQTARGSSGLRATLQAWRRTSGC